MNTAFAELRPVEMPITVACALTGRSRATHYGGSTAGVAALGPVHGPWLARGLPPSTITGEERARVLALVNSEPTETWRSGRCGRGSSTRAATGARSRVCTHRPQRRAEQGTTDRCQPPPRVGRAGRARPQRGVELGHHRVERTTKRSLVQTVRRARTSSPAMSPPGSSPTPSRLRLVTNVVTASRDAGHRRHSRAARTAPRRARGHLGAEPRAADGVRWPRQ